MSAAPCHTYSNKRTHKPRASLNYRLGPYVAVRLTEADRARWASLATDTPDARLAPATSQPTAI